tara:strand:- start:424 stop:1845 length:1422 start_codon:yes stop_codon:yes gene_type:complete
MAIDNETSLYTAGNVLGTKPNEELQNQNKDTTTETVTQPTAVTPTTTTSAPVFNRDQRVALTLLPLASALLQGKTQGGQSQLSGLLASAGQGLAGSANAALQIAQLEAQSEKTKTTTPKQYVLQEGFEGKVDVGGTQYSKADNIVFNFTPEQINAYPQGTFVEYTKPKTDKATSKEMFVEKEFEIDGVKYGVGTREIPQSVINKQLAIEPNVFGKAPTEDSDKATFRNYVFLKKKKTFKNKKGETETKMVNDTSQAYGVFDRDGELFVSVGGELIPQSKLIEEDKLGTIFTKSQFTGLQDRLDVKAFQKLQEKARDNQLKLQAFNDLYRALQDTGEGLTGRLNQIRAGIKLKTGQELNDAERAALEKEGALRKLIGQSRLDLFGPGVLTEFEQELAKQALVGNDKFINLDVAKSLLLKAARKGISEYEASLAEVHQQNDIRGQDYQYLDFDYRTLPLFADDIIQQKKDDGDKF